MIMMIMKIMIMMIMNPKNRRDSPKQTFLIMVDDWDKYDDKYIVQNDGDKDDGDDYTEKMLIC